MKNLLASLGIALVLAAPTTFAANGSDTDDADVKPTSGTATGSQEQAINTRTIIGGAIGIAGAGMLIGFAADSGGDGSSATPSTTTTITTN